MDMIVTTAIVFAALGVMVSYALFSAPTEQRLPIRIRAAKPRRKP